MDALESASTVYEPGASASGCSACPHCGAGQEYAVVGLTWDQDEQAWRCLLCGYRTFPRPRRSASQMEADLLWERLMEGADEQGTADRHDQQDEWAEEVEEGASTSSASGTSELL